MTFLLLESFWLYQCGVRNAYFLSYNCFEFFNLGLGLPVQLQPLVSFLFRSDIDRRSIGNWLGIDWESIRNLLELMETDRNWRKPTGIDRVLAGPDNNQSNKRYINCCVIFILCKKIKNGSFCTSHYVSVCLSTYQYVSVHIRSVSVTRIFSHPLTQSLSVQLSSWISQNSLLSFCCLPTCLKNLRSLP